jgi:hypothetical protein
MLKAHSGSSRLTARYRLADPLMKIAIRCQRPACGDVEAAGVSFHAQLDARNHPKDTFFEGIRTTVAGSASIVHRRCANWQGRDRPRVDARPVPIRSARPAQARMGGGGRAQVFSDSRRWDNRCGQNLGR